MTALSFALGFVAGAVVLWSVTPRRRKSVGASVDENGHWAFPIDTIDQMLAIPAERRERFLSELPDALRRMWELLDAYPIATLPGSVWVDDGLGEMRPHVVNAPPNAGDAFAARKIKPDGGMA